MKSNRILSFKAHAESEKPTCLFLRLLYALDSRCCGGILNASFREEIYLPFSWGVNATYVYRWPSFLSLNWSFGEGFKIISRQASGSSPWIEILKLLLVDFKRSNLWIKEVHWQNLITWTMSYCIAHSTIWISCVAATSIAVLSSSICPRRSRQFQAWFSCTFEAFLLFNPSTKILNYVQVLFSIQIIFKLYSLDSRTLQSDWFDR